MISVPHKHFTSQGLCISPLLLTLVAIKCQSTGTKSLKEHAAIMLCFLIALFLYAVAFSKLTYLPSNVLNFYVCHVSGALACELLLFILVTPIWWILINVSSALCFCFEHIPGLFRLVGKACFGI